MTRARSLSQLANSSVFTVATNNRVGIGSEVPTAKLDVDGTLNVSGNATIGGVATYEDVTNIDSVGIVTARSGVSVPDGQKILLGTSNDLEIFHDGTHSYIKNEGSGNLYIDGDTDDLVLQAGDDVRIQTQGNENAINCVGNGAVEIYYDNSKKFETTSTGVSITGAVTSSNNISANAFISPNNGNTTRFLISNASGNTVTMTSDGAATFSGLITANGNILSNRTGSTQTVFQGTLSGVTKVNITAGGSATFSAGITATGTDASSGLTINTTSAGKGVTVLGASGGDTRFAGDGSAIFKGTSRPSGRDTRISLYGSLLVGTTGNNVTTDANCSIDAGNGNIISSGSATFSSSITAQNTILANRTGSTQTAFQATLSGVTKVNIQAGGAAAFGSASNSTNNNGILLGADVGQFNLYTTRYSTDCFQILNTSGSGTNVAVRFDGNGTATFAGSVSATVGSFSGNVTSARTSSSHTCFNGTLNGTTTSNILANGNATFDGGITSKQEVYVLGTTTSTQRYLNFADAGTSNYRATLRRDAWYLGAPVTNIGNVTPSGANIVLNMNGNATFAGYVDIGALDLSNTSAAGIEVRSTGEILIQRPSSQGTSSIIDGRLGNTQNVNILANGSATFAGDILSTKSAGTIKAESSAHSKFAALYAGDGSHDSAVLWSSGALRFYNTTERMRIDSSGRLLIGKTASGANNARLQSASATGPQIVAQNIGTGAAYALFQNSTTGDAASGDGLYVGLDASKGYLWNYEGNDLLFGTNNAERMRLSGAGELFINTTSKIVNGLVSILFGTSHNGISIKPSSSVLNQNYLYFLNSAGSVAGYIRQTGTTTTFFGTSSDHRLKENVVDIADGITRVKQLQPRRFNFIADADTTVDGFLAHEAQTVVPEAVSGTHNEVDDDGNAVMQGIDQAKLVPLLTAALQEAIAKIETLESEVAALKAS